MIPRVALVTVALAIVLGLATACQPEPAPTASGPAFASEEEAFAAAEETYRAYVDALNQVDLSDPETFEPVYAWTTGDANESARKTFSEMHAESWTVAGSSSFDGFTFLTFASDALQSTVTAEVCLDVSDVAVTDASGQSVVPATRLDRQPAELTFVTAPTNTGLAIAASEATESDTCN